MSFSTFLTESIKPNKESKLDESKGISFHVISIDDEKNAPVGNVAIVGDDFIHYGKADGSSLDIKLTVSVVKTFKEPQEDKDGALHYDSDHSLIGEYKATLSYKNNGEDFELSDSSVVFDEIQEPIDDVADTPFTKKQTELYSEVKKDSNIKHDIAIKIEHYLESKHDTELYKKLKSKIDDYHNEV